MKKRKAEESDTSVIAPKVTKDKIPATISESAQEKEVEFGHYLTTPSFECENKFVGMAAGCASREDEVGTYY